MINKNKIIKKIFKDFINLFQINNSDDLYFLLCITNNNYKSFEIK